MKYIIIAEFFVCSIILLSASTCRRLKKVRRGICLEIDKKDGLVFNYPDNLKPSGYVQLPFHTEKIEQIESGFLFFKMEVEQNTGGNKNHTYKILIPRFIIEEDILERKILAEKI